MGNDKNIKCPICDGTGNIKAPKNSTEARKRRQSEVANKLRSEGYTIREIMALLGYKSTTSVQLLLKK